MSVAIEYIDLLLRDVWDQFCPLLLEIHTPPKPVPAKILEFFIARAQIVRLLSHD